MIFNKEGVVAEILGFFDLMAGENVKIETSSKHIAPNTSCSTFIKAVLANNSSFDYKGKILIETKAQQTSAYLHDNALVIGENTKRNSQPILEIEANDVKASHGSTTGRISEDQIYYLESRGLSRKQAEKTIKEGFMIDLVSKIQDKKVREKLLNEIKSTGETI